MNYRIIQLNGYKWYIQRDFKGEDYKTGWYYFDCEFIDGCPYYNKKHNPRKGFPSKESAEKYLVNTLRPCDFPEITQEFEFLTVTEEEKCVFETLRQMLQAEKNGNLKLAKKLNSQLLKLHELEKEVELNWWQRLLKFAGLNKN